MGADAQSQVTHHENQRKIKRGWGCSRWWLADPHSQSSYGKTSVPLNGAFASQ